MSKLLLVDGHNVLFKAFYGVPEKLLPDGRPIHGIIGFISILSKITDLTEPTHILVVFDPEEKPSRTVLHPPYKQNRQDYDGKPDRENPFSQLADIKRALDYLLIKWVEQPGYEADDMIACYASRVPCEVVIASSDTDFLQLVCEKTTMFRYHWKNPVLFTETAVREKFGIRPTSFLEYKALIGDKTDNISGIKGIGPKNAIKVLNGQRELGEQEQEVFERNRSLIKLNTGGSLHYTLDELASSNKLKGLKVFDYLRSIGVF